MKKIFLITPLTLLVSMLSFNTTLEAAGCSSHKNKNKNVKVECSLTDEDCDNTKSEISLNKVEV